VIQPERNLKLELEARLGFGVHSYLIAHQKKIFVLSFFWPPLKMALQFTENAIATRALECERISCKTIIQPGEPRLAAEDVTGHIKYVCAPCRQHYNEKLAASRLGNIVHTGIVRALQVSQI
jgi:hypothetical protein